MELKVIEANSINEAIQKIIESMVCSDCKCVDRVPAAVKAVEEPVTIEYFIKEIAKKKSWKPERAAGWIESIADLNPAAAFTIVLREIAVWLDKKYEDHIENSEKIYFISTFDGRIHEVCKKYIKNYRNFAAFRTIEDAKFACNLLRELLRDMFNNANKK